MKFSSAVKDQLETWLTSIWLSKMKKLRSYVNWRAQTWWAFHWELLWLSEKKFTHYQWWPLAWTKVLVSLLVSRVIPRMTGWPYQTWEKKLHWGRSMVSLRRWLTSNQFKSSTFQLTVTCQLWKYVRTWRSRVKMIGHYWTKLKTNATRKVFMKELWLLETTREWRSVMPRTWFERIWLKQAKHWSITNQEDWLFLDQVKNVLLLIANNGILTMVMKNGKRKSSAMLKLNLSAIVKHSTMTWFLPLTGWNNGVVQDHLGWEPNCLLINSTWLSLCLTQQFTSLSILSPIYCKAT